MLTQQRANTKEALLRSMRRPRGTCEKYSITLGEKVFQRTSSLSFFLEMHQHLPYRQTLLGIANKKRGACTNLSSLIK